MNLQVVRLLVEHGADVNIKGVNDHRPLHVAAVVPLRASGISENRADIVQYLIEHGAEWWHKNLEYQTPEYAMQVSHRRFLKELRFHKDFNGRDPSLRQIYDAAVPVFKRAEEIYAEAVTNEKVKFVAILGKGIRGLDTNTSNDLSDTAGDKPDKQKPLFSQRAHRPLRLIAEFSGQKYVPKKYESQPYRNRITGERDCALQSIYGDRFFGLDYREVDGWLREIIKSHTHPCKHRIGLRLDPHCRSKNNK